MHSLQKVHQYTFIRCYQFKILGCAHASHHINLFQCQLHDVLLLGSTHHIEWKHMTEKQDGAQENREHLTTEVGRHSPSGSFTTLPPPVQSARLTESVVFNCEATSTLDNERKRITDDFIIPSLVCGPFGDAAIHREFGRIMEINLAELVVVKPPQLKRLIIMTNRNIFLKWWRAFLLVLITFHVCRNKSFTH